MDFLNIISILPISIAYNLLTKAFKYSRPSWAILPTEPNECGFTNNMIFRNESPKSRILRIMTVVSHHPEIIHFECIVICFLSIDKYLPINFFPVVVLIYLNNPSIEADVF